MVALKTEAAERLERKERKAEKKAKAAAQDDEREQKRAAKEAKRKERKEGKEGKESKKRKAADEDKEPKRKERKERKEPKASIGAETAQKKSANGRSKTEIKEFLEKHKVEIKDERGEALPPIIEFSDADFPRELTENVFRTFERPTPIQAVTWPPLLAGRDVIGIAKTGSGKTLSFAVPVLLQLARGKTARPAGKGVQPHALVLSPTRELAMQIQDECERAGKPLGVRCVCVYGGMRKQDQVQALRAGGGAHIVVATPGRLVDLLDDRALDLSQTNYFVLDEADRMLDLGFADAIQRVVRDLPATGTRQTVMFSATWPMSVRELAASHLSEPVTISAGSTDLAANDAITQLVEVLEPHRKESRLLELLRQYHGKRTNRVLVFALYKKEASRLEQTLKRQGWRCGSIHGDKSQRERTDALQQFRSGAVPLLIATDVAARGIDIPDVEYVINYTFPLTIEEYCHRIGRTGRAGKTGTAHTLFTVHDKHHSGTLVNVLKQASQDVPESLLKFGTTVKKKEHKEYGAFYREVDPSVKATKITFGSDDDDE